MLIRKMAVIGCSTLTEQGRRREMEHCQKVNNFDTHTPALERLAHSHAHLILIWFAIWSKDKEKQPISKIQTYDTGEVL